MERETVSRHMSSNQQSEFSLPSTWLELNGRTVDLLLAVTILLGSVSLLAMAGGEPETMALVALTGIAVVFLGTVLVRVSEHLRTTGVSLQ